MLVAGHSDFRLLQFVNLAVDRAQRLGVVRAIVVPGGEIRDSLIALSSSPVTITGGTIGLSILLDSYGQEGKDGDVYIYGSDFQIDGEPAPYGAYHVSGHLTGMLANGDWIDNDFACSGTNDLILMPIPEPATVLFVTFGGLWVFRRR